MYRHLPDAVADALGRVVADCRQEFARDLSAIAAEQRAQLAELKLSSASVIRQFEERAEGLFERIEQRLATVRDGVDGAPGETGPRGDIGPVGERGEKGEPGHDGVPGERGADGRGIETVGIEDGDLVVRYSDGEVQNLGRVIGRDGADGKDGAPGEPGPQGERGEPGLAGPQGEPGPQGAPGERGIPGLQGEKGEKGEKGDQGESGPQGEKGAQGMPGLRGEDGAPGPHGEKGDPGTDGIPGERGEKGDAGPAGRDGQDGADGVGLAGAFINRDGHLLVTLTDGTTRELGLIVGKDGAQGPAGRDGKDGQDGVDFDDMEIVEVSDRAFMIRCTRGERVREWTLRKPGFIDRGVYKAGTTYETGDAVSFGGSLWIAQTTTSDKPGNGSEAWRLAVKAGRAGKDGRDGERGERGPEGPKGRDWTAAGSR